jgi:hypothetical protein
VELETPFFRDMKNMILHARLGLADWKLICTFLRCNRFVYEGTVPSARRFTRTLAFMDEQAVKAQLAATRPDEEQHWARRQFSAATLQAASNNN